MTEVELVLAVTNSDTLTEAYNKLKQTRDAVAAGHQGPLDGVEPWESPASALARLDGELEHVMALLLEEQIDEEYEVEYPEAA